MASKTPSELEDQFGAVIAFRASAKLVAGIEAVAAREGISKSDVVRRATLRDLRSQGDGSFLSRLLGSDDERVPA